MNNLQKLSDKELYEICKKLGAEALEARRKFAGVLPEVYKREQESRQIGKGKTWLEKHGFGSIFEFAAKLAGMSRDQVEIVLRLEKRFVDKPILHEALVNGEVSVNKLARVVSIATAENQHEMLGKVEVLSNRALEVFVKDFKNTSEAPEKLDGLQKSLFAINSLHVQVLHLDLDVEKELAEIQAKGIDVNVLLRQFLLERKEKLEREKSEVAEKEINERDERAMIGIPAKRYVPVEVRRVVSAEFGVRCSAEGCMKRAENLHHEKGFAKDQCHDPRFLKPLCGGHHELAHNEQRICIFKTSASLA